MQLRLVDLFTLLPVSLFLLLYTSPHALLWSILPAAYVLIYKLPPTTKCDRQWHTSAQRSTEYFPSQLLYKVRWWCLIRLKLRRTDIVVGKAPLLFFLLLNSILNCLKRPCFSVTFLCAHGNWAFCRTTTQESNIHTFKMEQREIAPTTFQITWTRWIIFHIYYLSAENVANVHCFLEEEVKMKIETQ